MTFLLAFLAYALALAAGFARAGHRSAPAPPAGGARSRLGRILVVGATGGTGRRLIAQALERGYAVTALVRDPAKLAIDHRGSPSSPATSSTPRRSAVRWLTGRRCSPPSGTSGSTRVLLAAMAAHRVRRLVCVTSLGIGDSAGRMGLPCTLFTIPVVLLLPSSQDL